MNYRLKIMAFIKLTLVSMASLIAAFLLLLCGLLFTHNGNIYLLDLAKKIEPRLTLELTRGTFFNSPFFNKVSWHDELNVIDLDALSYQFDWSCLAHKVCLEHLDIAGGQISLVQGEQTHSDEQMQPAQFKLPVAFAADNIHLSNIDFSVNGTSGRLTELHFRLQGKENEIILNADIQGLSVILADIKHEQAKPSEQNKNINARPALLLKQQLPEIKLPVNLKIAPLVINDLTIMRGTSKLFTLNKLTTRLEQQDTQLTIENLVMDLPETNIEVTGDINFSGQYPLNLSSEGVIKSIKQLQPESLFSDQHYKLKTYGDLGQLKSELLLTDKLNMQLTSEVDLLSENLPYRLDLSWDNFYWPLTGKSQYSSVKGQLQSSGYLNDYQITLMGDYLAANLPPGKIDLQGRGNLQQLNVKQLLIKTLDGSANLTGLLSWKDAIQWDGQLILDKLQLVQIDARYPSDFSGSIKQNLEILSHGQEKISWAFHIPQLAMEGRLLDQQVTINGALSGNNKKGFMFNHVMVKSAENTLTVNGVLNHQSDLNVDLNINDISHLLAGGAGNVQGKVRIKGEKTALNIRTRLQGHELTYQTTKIDSLSLSSDIIAAREPQVTLQLRGEKWLVAEHNVEQIRINIKPRPPLGVKKRHQVNLAVKETQGAATFEMEVMQDKQSWLSTLTAGSITLSEYLFRLTDPVTIVMENSNVLVSPHCWQISAVALKNSGQICAGKARIGEQGEAQITLKNFPLASLNTFLPDSVAVGGSLATDAHIHWQTRDNPQFTVNAAAQDMFINLIQGEGVDIITYPVEDFNLKLASQEKAIRLTGLLFVPRLMSSRISAQLAADKQAINGGIRLSVPDLSPLKILSPSIEKLSGEIQADLVLNGTLKKPGIDGQVAIRNSTLYVLGSPLRINQLNNIITIKNNQAAINGSFYSDQYNDYQANKTAITQVISFVDKSVQSVGQVIKKSETAIPQGKATITGNLIWQDKLRGDIHLFADKITVNDYDKVNLLVSPDVHLIIADSLQLTGNIDIDKGTIKVNELADEGVSISKDIIIVDTETTKKTPGLPIVADLQINLGDRLAINAFGLDAVISGQLQIRKRLAKKISLYGTLALTDGTYTALAQQLILQESKIVFQGPVATPYISIEANRDPDETEDDVTAGVQVTGTPDNLSLTLVSEPTMAQQEILSYLVQGQSLENSNSSNSQVNNMLIALQLGAANSFGILNKFGSQLGIEDLSLSASGSGDEQSIGLSGYIAPRVELSYGLGVFDNFSIFAIRYEIFEQFYIEASSGLEQAIDAYYQFDWD